MKVTRELVGEWMQSWALILLSETSNQRTKQMFIHSNKDSKIISVAGFYYNPVTCQAFQNRV